MITEYRTLTNNELIDTLDIAAEYSPVIQELCSRLEKAVIICPICKGNIERFNDANKQ